MKIACGHVRIAVAFDGLAVEYLLVTKRPYQRKSKQKNLSRRIYLACWIAAIAITGLLHAQNTPAPMEDEVSQRLHVKTDISPLSQTPFGEKVNLYNGSLSFEETDVDLEGTGPSIKLTRSFEVDDTSAPEFRDLVDWKLDTPRIETLTSPSDPNFFVSSPSGRCSGIPTAAVPDVITLHPVNPPPIALYPDAWWYGYHLIMPGTGAQDLIIPGAQNTLPLPQINIGGGLSVKAIMVTRKNWAVGCLSSTSNGAPGQGFIAIAPNGTRYWLDWLVYRRMTQYGSAAPVVIQRNLAKMLVSHIVDRFGNTLTYTYDGFGNLTNVAASDGRSLAMTYENYPSGTTYDTPNPDPAYRLKTAQVKASDGTIRTWTYNYSTNGLTSVVLPDGSAWSYSLQSFEDFYDVGNLHMILYQPYPPCSYTLSNPVTNVGTITHPSGLTGTFTVKNTVRGRSYVPYVCVPSIGSYYLAYRNVMSYNSLIQESLSGAGLSTPTTWNYSYSPPNQSWSTDACASNNSCAGAVYTDVTDPNGHDVRYTFSNRFDATEGQILDTTSYSAAAGSSIVSEVKSNYANFNAGPWPTSLGTSLGGEDNAAAANTLTPENQRQTLQDGDTYSWLAEGFNSFAQVTKTKRYNSISYEPSIEEQMSYVNDTAFWVLGLPQEVDNLSTGEIESLNTYAPIDTLLTRSRFGELLMSYTFDGEGNLSTFKDGDNNVTTLGNYNRGIPQVISYPDNTSESLSVDDFAQIKSITDQNGATTSYTYDAAGRVNGVSYPANDDVNWYPTTIAYSFVGSERGITGNHWRRTSTTGNYQELTYFDAKLQPILMDSNFISGGAVVPGSDITSEKQYDFKGQTLFASYPVQAAPNYGDSSIATGMHSTYDALERLSQTQQDSELGTLTTSIVYSYGARKLVTDPKGNLTTTAYQVFDQPVYDTPIQVLAPTGIEQDIGRDLYGNPTSISQSGTYNGQNVSLTRYLAYDSYHRLCRIFEPESNSTVYSYDGANNIAWLATGAGIVGDGTVCGTTQVPASIMTTRTYDQMNRLKIETPPSGTQSTTYNYDPTGQLTTTISGIVIQGHNYDKRGLLTGESQWIPGDNNFVRSIGYGYDAYGHLSTIVYPDGGVFGTFPNPRGRATLVQGGNTLYASGISYYPDGATAGYSLNNGIVATIQRNIRQLPSNITYNQGGNLRFSEAYVYDPDANLTAVTDLVNGKNNQTLGYDGVNRLTSDTAPNNWGTEAYTYDPLNNIRLHAITGLTLSFNFDGTNRLTTITQGTPTGAGFANFQYDPRGNQTQSTEVFTVTPHTFDAKNQMLQIPGVAVYSYDEAGRRLKKVLNNGQVSYFFYSQAGQLMYEYNPATGQATDYLYLNGKLITRYQPGQNPTYLLTDRLGTPVRETDPSGVVTQSFSYRPFGQLYSGASQQQPSYTGHVLDPESSLSYMQARYQDGGLGQFLSVDPMKPAPGDVLNFNRYAYADNNPIINTDPTGQSCSSGARSTTCTEDETTKYIHQSVTEDPSSSVQLSPAAIDRSSVGKTTVGKLSKTMTNEDGSLSGGKPGDLQNAKTALANAIINNASLKRPAKVAPPIGKSSIVDSQTMRDAYLNRIRGGVDPVEGRTQFGNSTQNLTSRSASNGLSGSAGIETVYKQFGPFDNSIGPPTYIYIYNNPGN